jgi:hypothetical protein
MLTRLTNRGTGPACCVIAMLALAGCTLNPIGQQTPRPVSVAPSAPMTGTTSTDMSAGTSASAAEQACMGAGRERNLDVVGVVGSRSASDVNGDASRDVMLRVRRNGAEIEVRCNYVSSTGLARIMLI